MVFNEFSIKMFNKYTSHLNLLVAEKHDLPIFMDKKKNLLAGRTTHMNYKVVAIEEISEINDELYFQINYKNNVKGYFVPETSIILIPKEREQVKLVKDVGFDNSINTHLGIEDEEFEVKKSKILYSNYYAIYEGEVHEGLALQNMLVGFFPSKQIHPLKKIAKDFKVVEATSYYSDSGFINKIGEIEPSEQLFRSQYVIPDEKKLRFKNGKKSYWIAEEPTDVKYDFNNFRSTDPSEVLIESILYQYDDKLENYHSYYLKVLNKELKK
ncbi:hypothetical protein [Salinicoccus roseus]|uniref:hypothetical protein n=1 Tax=Salinicoccus roseus TaxID=45670 RepID=UPI000F5131CE|nr:hypothetical protein [Salinicoccus roseus]RPE54804.1 hypothetical protein EDC33_1067 [Salinicoccus roseus]GGA62515.1 hypothetical protein GCM10007176_03670 [Salinicoccus roseus]